MIIIVLGTIKEEWNMKFGCPNDNVHTIHTSRKFPAQMSGTPPLKTGSPDSGGYVKFTPKYIIVVWWGVRIFLLTKDRMQSFRTLGQPFLGESKVHPQIYHGRG